MASKDNETGSFTLNAAIGFLSLLLVLLVFGLFTRIIFPRIQNQRAEATPLIGNIIQLEVLNGEGTAGLAQEVTAVLRKNGFDVVETGNFKNFNMEKTVLIARTDNDENARRVAEALGIAPQNIIIEASEDFYLDATIVIGSDYNSLKLN